MQSIEPFQLQRLVDGELEFEEVRKLLQIADSDAHSWRLIASAFVEDKIWQGEFADQLDSTESESNSQTIASMTMTSARSNAPQMWWMSLAASVMLALSVGFLIGQGEFSLFGTTSNPNSIAGGPVDPSEGTSEPAPLALAQSEAQGQDLKLNPAVYHMQLEDQQGNQFMDSEIPLYPVKQSGDLQRLRPVEIPISVRQQARDSGYQIQQNIRYVSGQLKDGRQFVIPIRNYRFSPNQ